MDVCFQDRSKPCLHTGRVRVRLFSWKCFGRLPKTQFGMKNAIRVLLGMATFAGLSTHAQFNSSQVQYWVGAGADTSVLVVDFQDGSSDGSSFAWGYLHDGATAEQMLLDIAAADVNLVLTISSGFLSDITYGAHAGLGGAPDYWSSWSGTDIATMVLNGGVSEPLANGEWFGCSYTDFDPALLPTTPLPAYDPFRFTADDITYWVGAGSDTALLVVDFQDGAEVHSYAWGYLFTGTVNGEMMLMDIAAADPMLDVTFAGGLLNDITYGTHVGLYGDPNYWSTWSGTNLGNWYGNLGVGTTVSNGDLFGCSYTDLAPALRPSYPQAASGSTYVMENERPTLLVYPQPATELLYVNSGPSSSPMVVYDMAGHRVHVSGASAGLRSIDVSAWPAGSYVLQMGSAKRSISVH